MKKTRALIYKLEGLKKQTMKAQVDEVLGLYPKSLGTELALHGPYGPLMTEFILARDKAQAKSLKLLSKNPDMTFDELVRKVCKR